MKETNKLYLVKLRGMHTTHGIAYVVAENTEIAYKKVLNHLKSKDIGFSKDRELASVELLAEDNDYTNCPHRLYL